MEREFDISCGVDVGKWSHHFTAIDGRTGEVLLDAKIGQDEREIRDALGELMCVGRTMVVVDQPGSMSALLFAIADDMGAPRGLITPRAMAQAIEMYGGEVKTDAHDAFVIAEVSANLPRTRGPSRGQAHTEPALPRRACEVWSEGGASRGIFAPLVTMGYFTGRTHRRRGLHAPQAIRKIRPQRKDMLYILVNNTSRYNNIWLFSIDE